MSEKKFKTRISLGITLAIILVVILGICSYLTSVKERKSEEWVRHALLVKEQLQNIHLGLKDDATFNRARRRYATTPALIAQVPAEEIMTKLANLHALVADNAVQVRNVLSMQAKVEQLFTFWENTDLEATRGNIVLEEKYFRDEIKILSGIRSLINAMNNEENRLLAKRNEATNKWVEFNTIANLGGSALIFIMVVGLSYNIRREFQKRRAAESKLKATVIRQQQQNDEIALNNEVLNAARELGDNLQDADDVTPFLQQVLEGILSFTGITSGIAYLSEEHSGGRLLKPVAYSGLPKEKIREQYTNELLTPFIDAKTPLKIIDDIPPGFWQIETVSGAVMPGAVIYIFMHLKGKLLGVIELGSIKTPDERVTKFLDIFSGSLAVRLSMIQFGQSRTELFKELREKNETLMQQQEELSMTNEELSSQAKILLASEEELRVQEEELKQINVELEEKHDALEIARQSMAQKAGELELSTKFKSEFLANMSHELRTPLNSILILANLLGDNKEQNLSNKQIEYAKIISNAGSDLLHLINDILDLSKIEAGKVELIVEEVIISSIANHMEDTFELLAEQKKINLAINIDPDVQPFVHTDVQRLEQILKNLLSNAVKFTPQGGSVTMTISQQEDLISFSVRDTGIGIDDSKLDLIFEAFKQEDGSTNRRFGGTGLGLSISKELARMLYGFIEVESKIGEGSCFTLSIPLKIQPSSVKIAAVNEQSTAAAEATTHVASGKKTILIIEDDMNFAGILRGFAEERGFETLMAGNGIEGLEMAHAHHPHAIILDLQVPVMNGWEILKELRKDAALAATPVHIISASGEATESYNNIIRRIKKPVTFADLESVFRQIRLHGDQNEKRLLIWTADKGKPEIVNNLRANMPNGLAYDIAHNARDVSLLANQYSYACLLADIGDHHHENIAQLQLFKEDGLLRNVPIILLIDKEISASYELELRQLSEAIVLKSEETHKRLKDELEMFVRKVKEQQDAPATASEPAAGNNVLDGKKILVVDDDMRNVFALNSILEANGMEIITATNGREAIETLEQTEGISLILMDIMMPEMDGYEAMRAIRANSVYAQLPIIALTAKAMSNDRDLCIEAGASDYISKPVDAAKLLSLMRIWLS